LHCTRMRLPLIKERWPLRRNHHMPERQHHAKIANELADRLQRSADVPHWNKSERQTIEGWAGSRDDIRTSHPPACRAGALKPETFEVSLAVTKEITHANHHERQFMQYQQVGGWRKASALPDSPRVIEKLPTRFGLNGSRVPLTASFIELLKKAPLPRRPRSRNLRCPLRLDADRVGMQDENECVANVEAIR
jgi:hypothetical protein